MLYRVVNNTSVFFWSKPSQNPPTSFLAKGQVCCSTRLFTRSICTQIYKDTLTNSTHFTIHRYYISFYFETQKKNYFFGIRNLVQLLLTFFLWYGWKNYFSFGVSWKVIDIKISNAWNKKDQTKLQNKVNKNIKTKR